MAADARCVARVVGLPRAHRPGVPRLLSQPRRRRARARRRSSVRCRASPIATSIKRCNFSPRRGSSLATGARATGLAPWWSGLRVTASGLVQLLLASRQSLGRDRRFWGPRWPCSSRTPSGCSYTILSTRPGQRAWALGMPPWNHRRAANPIPPGTRLTTWSKAPAPPPSLPGSPQIFAPWPPRT